MDCLYITLFANVDAHIDVFVYEDRILSGKFISRPIHQFLCLFHSTLIQDITILISLLVCRMEIAWDVYFTLPIKGFYN